MPEVAASSFPPIEAPGARVLVLGSLPGTASIEAKQYYAHPRNAFWTIMAELADARGDYEARCGALMRRGIMVWDVLAQSVRPGSLDASIRMDTAVANDFAAVFQRQPDIELVALNGRKAADMFRRFARPPAHVRSATLPSTSPAYAALSIPKKLERWRDVLAPILNKE
ncbi:MAG: DNA-deoxyinosine glycosylase [Pseudomonadota bacterium]